MRKVLVFLVFLTMACGAAVTVTVNFSAAYADDSGKGY
jgi:hypothetical protein